MENQKDLKTVQKWVKAIAEDYGKLWIEDDNPPSWSEYKKERIDNIKKYLDLNFPVGDITLKQ